MMVITERFLPLHPLKKLWFLKRTCKRVCFALYTTLFTATHCFSVSRTSKPYHLRYIYNKIYSRRKHFRPTCCDSYKRSLSVIIVSSPLDAIEVGTLAHQAYNSLNAPPKAFDKADRLEKNTTTTRSNSKMYKNDQCVMFRHSLLSFYSVNDEEYKIQHEKLDHSGLKRRRMATITKIQKTSVTINNRSVYYSTLGQYERTAAWLETN